jgi:hypothetical protein
MKTVPSKHFLRIVTVVISILLMYSTINITNGAQTNNLIDILDNSRDTTYLSIVPYSQTVDYGETFSIIVHLDPGEPVIGVQIDLSFTPSLIQVVSVALADPEWFFFPPIINNSVGEIHGAAVAVFGTTVTTPIDCFQITFTAQSIDGVSPLTLHDVIITNQSAEPISPVISNGLVIVGNPVNLPPVFGSPSPVNGSTGQPLSLTWSIPINDPEGNTFSWMIQCSNGQSNSGTGTTNGTKSLAISSLAYATTYKIWVNATDPTGSGLYTRKWFTFSTQQQPNSPPNKPNKPTGPASGKPGTVYTYSTSTTDPNGDQVYYLWDWGDGSQSNWLGPYNSGVTINTTHTWTTKGSYSIKVKAKDTFGTESSWSDPLPITMPKNNAYTFHVMFLQILKQIFERFPNTFPILRHLTGY